MFSVGVWLVSGSGCCSFLVVAVWRMAAFCDGL